MAENRGILIEVIFKQGAFFCHFSTFKRDIYVRGIE